MMDFFFFSCLVFPVLINILFLIYVSIVPSTW
uniref:Uncharacterized protein n=1 Tax=Rhizophora mucronata TaxID=61149 RepID=A0A2P2R4U4_RHIMU